MGNIDSAPQTQHSTATQGAVAACQPHAAIDLAFLMRLGGMLLVAAMLSAIPQLAHADRVDYPASAETCQRNLRGLIDQTRDSATKVVFAQASASSRSATIFVADGQVRIACDDVRHRMSITRTVNGEPNAEPVIVNQ